MNESVTIFENEDAVRLLNYFISYKEIFNKNENKPSPNLVNDGNATAIVAEPERIVLK
jgi:hypothetical protein